MNKTKCKDAGFLTETSLNKIKKEVGKRKLIIHGPTGVGKTTFTSKNHKKVFITTEEKGNGK